jgi:hypothetical protein
MTPARVASRAKAARDALIARDDAIRQLAAEGASLRTIAAAAGLTHGGIAKIIRR